MMSNYFKLPEGPELILLLAAIAAYAVYWLVLRKRIRAYLRRGQDDPEDLGT
jgi:hypothetical protein